MIHLILEYMKTKDTKYIFVVLYLLGLASMQLTEFFIFYFNFKSSFSSWLVLYAIIFQFVLTEIYIHYNKIFPTGVCVLEVIFYIAVFALMFMIKGKSVKDTVNCEHPYIWLGCKLNWGILDNMLDASGYLTMIAMMVYVVYVTTATYGLFTAPVFAVFLVVYFITMFLPRLVDMYYKKNGFGTFRGSSSAWCFFVIILTVLLIILDENQVIR